MWLTQLRSGVGNALNLVALLLTGCGTPVRIRTGLFWSESVCSERCRHTATDGQRAPFLTEEKSWGSPSDWRQVLVLALYWEGMAWSVWWMYVYMHSVGCRYLPKLYYTVVCCRAINGCQCLKCSEASCILPRCKARECKGVKSARESKASFVLSVWLVFIGKIDLPWYATPFFSLVQSLWENLIG